MRFDSIEYLQAWQYRGVFPHIHDAIAQVILTDMQGSRILDLGCSFGLLAERVMQHAGVMVAFGVDSDAEILQQGEAAGIGADLVQMEITPSSLPALYRLVAERGVDVLICRRVLPELFGDDLPLGRAFAREIALAGIKEVFVEGRVVSVRSVNALYSIAEEVALLSGSFREVRRVGAVSYLRAVS